MAVSTPSASSAEDARTTVFAAFRRRGRERREAHAPTATRARLAIARPEVRSFADKHRVTLFIRISCNAPMHFLNAYYVPFRSSSRHAADHPLPPTRLTNPGGFGRRTTETSFH
jgi:hypothetical protein